MNKHKNAYKHEHLPYLKEITKAKLQIIQIKDKLDKLYKNQWSYKDCLFLVENWGQMPAEEIAKRLKKSYTSVISTSTRLSLKNAKLYSNYISLVDLFTHLNGNVDNYRWRKKLLIKYNAPIVKRCFYKEKIIDCINANDFFNWFKDHIHIMDIKDYDFKLDAPDWFDEKAKADKRAYVYCNKRKWTEAEKETIIEMINQGFGYRDISTKLKRTGGSLKRFFTDNKIKIRPTKADNHIPWTNEEIGKVKDLYLKGYKPCIMQEYINRSDLAINGILERYKYFGKIPERFRKD